MTDILKTHISAAASAALALLSRLLGWDAAVSALLLLMVIDSLASLLAAIIRPAGRLSSARGLRGICKKLLILLLVAVANTLEQTGGIPALHAVVVWFFIGNEGLSILENAVKAGIPVPRRLRAALEGIAQEKEP